MGHVGHIFFLSDNKRARDLKHSSQFATLLGPALFYILSCIKTYMKRLVELNIMTSQLFSIKVFLKVKL